MLQIKHLGPRTTRAPAVRTPTTTEPSTPTPIDQSSEEMKAWYMKHMASVLQSSSDPQKPKATLAPSLDGFLGSCPSHCECSCPGSAQVTMTQQNSLIEPPGNSNQAQKLNLGLTLVPCGRSAIYNLDLALNLCRPRVSISSSPERTG